MYGLYRRPSPQTTNMPTVAVAPAPAMSESLALATRLGPSTTPGAGAPREPGERTAPASCPASHPPNRAAPPSCDPSYASHWRVRADASVAYGSVDVQRCAGPVGLRVNELKPQWRSEILEQRKSFPQCDRLQDEPVLIDQSEPAQRLRKRRAAPGEHVLP